MGVVITLVCNPVTGEVFEFNSDLLGRSVDEVLNRFEDRFVVLSIVGMYFDIYNSCLWVALRNKWIDYNGCPTEAGVAEHKEKISNFRLQYAQTDTSKERRVKNKRGG